jgi:cell division protein FtsB
MKDVQPPKKKVKTRKLYSKPVLIGLAILIVFIAKGTWGVYQKEIESRKNVAMVMTELESLEERKAFLEAETEKLNSMEGKEEVIRQKYQVSKNGEGVLVVVDKPLPVSDDENDRNFFSKMWHSVSGIFKGDE